MRRALGALFCSLLALGTNFPGYPIPLLWIRGSHERGVWLISGPYPYDNLGGPFRIMVCSGLFAAGFVLTSVAPILRALLRNPL